MKAKEKATAKSETRVADIPKIGSQIISKAIDKSRFQLGHHKIVESKDVESKRDLHSVLFNGKQNRQKKQFGMKRGRDNIKHHFRNKCLM
ncbi:unnamed protein product [Moneuplotes crassus]|uniref:Uncharacterized protein n=1 Tax=Euplotes crassus TaxID=5936 RepID=A0AAD1Y059_EUPCR|nr:unnamed protein product [Moneuplotes crassus]